MVRQSLKVIASCILIFLSPLQIKAQDDPKIMDYMEPDEYVVGDITVSGVKYLDINAIVGLSGIRKYSRILVPG
ncbi:MAG: hypothetical protein KFF49_10530, partial [Bacteroidales bacterium]|nr:hypothetical protein [Bacteroidales bacterium]